MLHRKRGGQADDARAYPTTLEELHFTYIKDSMKSGNKTKQRRVLTNTHQMLRVGANPILAGIRLQPDRSFKRKLKRIFSPLPLARRQ
jgi:hypothetical protein